MKLHKLTILHGDKTPAAIIEPFPNCEIRVEKGSLHLPAVTVSDEQASRWKRGLEEAIHFLKTGEYRGVYFEHTQVKSLADQPAMFWHPGGTPETLTGFNAQIAACAAILANPGDFLWEVREPGEPIGDDPLFFKYLEKAVNAALPGWKDAGLDLPRAIALSMNAGLLLSTGIPVGEWEFGEDEE
jgi:hypothetical protein